jgi:predicted RNA binding protein YcfA (HicA-like mRNA interferase family)
MSFGYCRTLVFVKFDNAVSHKQFRHADGRATTVPFHKGRDISPVLLRKIAEDIRVALEILLSGNCH